MNSTARLLLVVFLLILLIGLLPTWGYSTSWGMGWYPSSGLGIVLVVVVALLILGKL